MNKAIRLLLLGIVCNTLYTNSYAQLNNSFFKYIRSDTAPGVLRLQIENLNYFRNLEYKSHIDEGRTLFGYQFAPEVNYQLSNAVQVSGGVFLQRDFGGTGFYKLLPLYSLQYKRGQKTFRFGNLFGSVQHNLVEPLYDPEKVIENRMENGFQFIWNRPEFYMDAWIDWQKMIYQNSAVPEQFMAGIIVEPKWLNNETVSLSTPISMLAFHTGGEIDTSHHRTLSSFNFDYAGKCVIRPKGKIDSIDLQAHFLYYEDISNPAQSFIDGLGQMVSAAIYVNHFGFMINYWDAHQFQAPFGDVIYQSVSFKNSALYTSHYRKMAMARLFYETEIAKDLRFLFRTNYIRDINKNTDNFIAEFYFRWTPTFVLKTIGN